MHLERRVQLIRLLRSPSRCATRVRWEESLVDCGASPPNKLNLKIIAKRGTQTDRACQFDVQLALPQPYRWRYWPCPSDGRRDSDSSPKLGSDRRT